jgi:hypothetical protein
MVLFGRGENPKADLREQARHCPQCGTKLPFVVYKDRPLWVLRKPTVWLALNLKPEESIPSCSLWV